jgi:hypothetical protein
LRRGSPSSQALKHVSIFGSARPGRPRRVSPQRILGKSIFWWMDGLGILRASRETRVGKYLMRTDLFPGKSLGLGRLRQQGIRVLGRLSQVEGKTVTFTGGEAAEVDAVIWATGYKDNGKWVTIPEVKDASGGFMHEWGVSPTPDLTPWAAVGSGHVGRPCSSAMTLPTRLARSPSDYPRRWTTPVAETSQATRSGAVEAPVPSRRRKSLRDTNPRRGVA